MGILNAINLHGLDIRRHIKATIRGKLRVDAGPFKAGDESDLLVDLGDGKFHFEKGDEAVIVKTTEVVIWEMSK